MKAPSPVEAAFIDEVQAAPSEDDARLVYADWLEENNELLKAEYLRLEIALLNAGYEVMPSLAERARSELETRRARFEEVKHLLDEEWRDSVARVPKVKLRIDATKKARIAVASSTSAATSAPSLVLSSTPVAPNINLSPATWVDDRPPKTEVPFFGRSVGGDGAGLKLALRLRRWLMLLALGLLLGGVFILSNKYGCGDRDLPRMPNPANPANPGGR